MKVSIILPTYNRARFLESAIASITSQSFTDWELVVVDDGSTDDSRELIEDLLAAIPNPTRYHYQPNGGVGRARNVGLGLARGRYVAFFDSDDLWHPSYLRSAIEVLDHHGDVDW